MRYLRFVTANRTEWDIETAGKSSAGCYVQIIVDPGGLDTGKTNTWKAMVV